MEDRGPPSAASIAIGTAIVSGLFGYYIGQARSIGLLGGSSTAQQQRQQTDDDESDTSDADSQGGDAQEVGELKSFKGSNEECKLVLVTRTDLGMGKGKECAFLFSLHTLRSISLAGVHTRAIILLQATTRTLLMLVG